MFKIVRRGDASKKFSFSVRIAGVLLALALTSLFLIFMGLNPIEVFGSMLKAAFGSPNSIRRTITLAIPIVILSLGVMIAFKMKFWNIGGEGQMIMGGFAASYFAINFSHLPSFVLIPIMAIAGMAMGGIWGMIAAFFKAKFKTNETLITLMLNYIAIWWATYLQSTVWRGDSYGGFNKVEEFADSAVIPKLFGIQSGFIPAIILVVVVALLLRKTKLGYEISIVGDSPNTAKYAGISVTRVIITTMFISGALAGLAGMLQVSSTATFSSSLTQGAGNTAIITAWLSNLSEVAVVPVAVLFSALIRGAEGSFNLQASSSQVIQGMILFFVLASEFFVNYKVVLRKERAKK